MTAEKRKTWGGGHIHVQQDGRPLFIIERRRGKQRFHISTRTHSETAAHAHLKRFEADPWAYAEEMKSGRADAGELHITTDLIVAYHHWMLSRHHPTTDKHANETHHRLDDWMVDLGTRDLRNLDLPSLKAMVEKRGTSRQHRIIAIKAFFSWLRKERGLLERSRDVTLDWSVPQAVPEKHRRKKAMPVGVVRKALREMPPKTRDALLVLAHTGWHVTELRRFATHPEARIAPGKGRVLAVLQTWHKTKKWTRTPLTDRRVVAAAKRVRENGVPSRLSAIVKAACKRAGVSEFTPGVMRHTVASWAAGKGATAEEVAEFIDHDDRSTSSTFYIDLAVPTRTVKLPDLF